MNTHMRFNEVCITLQCLFFSW